MPNDLMEPTRVLEVYVDGFMGHEVRDGVMTCVGYRRMPDGKMVVLRLAWPVVNTTEAIESATAAAAAPVITTKRCGPKRGVH